jgi:hypothetical protein
VHLRAAACLARKRTLEETTRACARGVHSIHRYRGEGCSAQVVNLAIEQFLNLLQARATELNCRRWKTRRLEQMSTVGRLIDDVDSEPPASASAARC